tara:strand:+ start:135 stop:344 length:210 start_codon:yes stop_codon:yes gene_type:complete
MFQRFETQGSSRHPEWTSISFQNTPDHFETEAGKRFAGASSDFIQYKAEEYTHRAACDFYTEAAEQIID